MAINRDKVHAAAAKLLQQGKFDKAIAELVKLVEDDPTDVRTWLKLGETYPKIGKKPEALVAFEKAASIYAEQGFFLKAVAVLKQLLRVDPNVPPMHLKLAELYQQLGLTPDALQHYQNVAVFYEQQGKPRQTLDILKRMVDLDPDNLPSRIKLGELFAQQGLQKEAVNELRSALSFLKAQQRFDDFCRVGEKLVGYDPSAADVARELARVYLTQRQANVALSKLQIAFKHDGRNVETLGLMAQAFLELQQVGKTVVVYKELAKIHTTDGNGAEAQQQWQRVLSLVPDDAEAQAALGFGEPSDATTLLPHQAGGPPLTFSGAAPSAFAPNVSPLAPPDGNRNTRAPTFPSSAQPAPVAMPDVALSAPKGASGLPSGLHPPAASAAPTAELPRVATAGAATGAVIAAPPGSELDPLEQQLLKLLTETDVYVKYGLKDKAREHLTRIFALKPDHIPALEKHKQMLQPIGGRELKEALRKLVFAADEQNHPQLAMWKAELSQTDNKPTTTSLPRAAFSEPPRAASGPVNVPRAQTPAPVAVSGPSETYLEAIDEEILLDDAEATRDAPAPAPGAQWAQHSDDPGASSDVTFELPPDANATDEPFLPNDVNSLPDLPPDVGPAEGEFGYDGTSPQFADGGARAPLAPPDAGPPHRANVPRMPSGVMDVPLQRSDSRKAPGVAPSFSSQPAAFDQANLGLPDDEILVDDADISPDSGLQERPPGLSDDLMRAALRDVSEEDLSAAADELLLDAPVDAPSAWPAGPAGALRSDEGGALERMDEVARLALTGDASAPVASTALMGLTRSELEQIRAFEGDDAISEDVPHDAFASSSVKAAPVEDTLALVRPTSLAPSLDMPADVRALLKSSPAPAPQTAAARGPAAASAEATGFRAPPATSSAAPMGKLGLAKHAQGFEADQATQFFPDELEEAEFFIQQDLLDEAREILASIAEDVPDSPRVQWMMERIDAREAGEPEPPAPWEQRILDEMEAQLAELEPVPPAGAEPDRQISVDEVLSAFKKGIAETVPEDDAATHYDLGCAYRDMGLLDDALNEFAIAARANNKAVDARYLIGVTLLDQGKHAEASAAFGEAVASPLATRDQRAASKYQLGVCKEAMNAAADALRAFQQAKELGHVAADLDRRIAQLSSQVAIAGAPRAASVPKGKNIDYL